MWLKDEPNGGFVKWRPNGELVKENRFHCSHHFNDLISLLSPPPVVFHIHNTESLLLRDVSIRSGFWPRLVAVNHVQGSVAVPHRFDEMTLVVSAQWRRARRFARAATLWVHQKRCRWLTDHFARLSCSTWPHLRIQYQTLKTTFSFPFSSSSPTPSGPIDSFSFHP